MRQKQTVKQRNLLMAFGLVSALGLLVVATLTSKSPSNFFSWQAFLIVIGGTFFVTIASFTFEQCCRAFKSVSGLATSSPPSLSNTATQVLTIADQVRRQSKRDLNRVSTYLRRHPQLAHAIELLSDGIDEPAVINMLRDELNAHLAEQRGNAQFFRRAADVAPAMGLIGTLVGLIQMMGSLNDPAAIGPAMAIALLTTLYGAILANMILSPIATKIERDAEQQAAILNLYRAGAASICRRENPRKLELALNSMLPPQERVQYFN